VRSISSRTICNRLIESAISRLSQARSGALAESAALIAFTPRDLVEMTRSACPMVVPDAAKPPDGG
jgi:hypothetical protein